MDKDCRCFGCILPYRDRARLPRASALLPEAGSLFFACSKKSNQKKEPPAWRWPGLRPSQSVRGGRAFRPGSCPDEKCPTSLSGTPAGPARPPLTAPQGLVEGSCRCAAHRVATPVAAVRCGSAPCARPWTDRVASICDRRDDARPRCVATWLSRTGCAPTEVGRSFASTHPSPQPSPRSSTARPSMAAPRVPRRGEGEKTAVRCE